MKILFIRLDHIGDCFLTLPAIREFRKAYPEYEVHILCKQNVSEIFQKSGLCDKIHTINLSHTCNKYEKKDNIKTILSKIRFLNSQKYDYLYNFRPDFRESFFLSLIHGKDISNYRQKLYKDNIHILDRNLINLKKRFEKIDAANNSYVRLQIPEKFRADDILELEKSILFHIGGSYMKKFSDEKIYEIYRKLKTINNNKINVDNIYIVKSKYDKFKYSEQVKLLEVDNVDEWAGLCEISQIIIGFDTGPMHIAAAHARKVFSIWGPTSIDYFGLRGDNVINYKVKGYKNDFIPGERFSFKKYGDHLQKTDVEKIYQYLMNIKII